MIKEVKRPQNRILFTLAKISLLVILIIVAIGTLSGRYTFFLKRNNGSVVLGISEKLPLNKIKPEIVEQALQGAVSSTKSEISKKALEVEDKLKASLEKEISELTSAQIKSIQTKICRDWGIVKE